MPLQLIILVVIAGIAIAILVAWLTIFSGSDLKTLTCEPSSIDEGVSSTITITAWDSSDSRLEGVVVTIRGAGVDDGEITNGNGDASFTITPELPPGTATGMITATGTYSGNIQVEKKCTILVK